MTIKERYKINKNAKTGVGLICPSCGVGFIKNSYQQVFCKSKSGSKYIKLIENSLGSDRVHCFLDTNGNIYKAESWRKPAKGIRGHIDNDKKPLLLGDYYNYK
jgi:hypothetical protein